jgi:copper(I)-binding protein
MKKIVFAGAALLAATLSTPLFAQSVDVANPWVRATVAGQKSTGAFMQLTAKTGAKLVAGSSPVAGVVEIHEMKMEGDVMKMRAIDGGLDLPAGKAVDLKPGGYHVMLMDLKAPLQKDSTVPVTLVFKDSKGVETKTEVKMPVAMAAPGSKPGAMGADMPGMGHGK